MPCTIRWLIILLVLMRRALLFLPLLGLAPLGDFLSAYLDGAGLLPRGSGFLIGAACMFLLPWVVAASFLMVKVTWPGRLLLFMGAMVAQGVLLFTVIPAGATSEMIGIAHRLRREFPPDQIRTCAATLRQKQHDGTLAVRQGKRDQSFLMSERAVLVDDAELPVPLRGRFERVFIQPDQDAPEQRVYFSLDERTGIVCDSRKHVREFFVCSMADGVHAYRYQRL
jgi:hypothetical protein